MHYLAWEQWWLARQCSLDQLDVFHSPVHFGLPQATSTKCVLTLHDAIDEIYYSSEPRSLSQRVTSILSGMARFRADHILTVSDYSRRDIMRVFGIPDHKISVTYGAADARFGQEISLSARLRVRAKYELPERFFFYVGSLEPRKNLPFLLHAFAESGLRDIGLVVGGNGRELRDLSRLAAELGIASQVKTVGRIDDEDLPTFYTEAQAFVYPSEYEGFGLQLCEAMSAGCPVLAARASCLPEILGTGGDLFSISEPTDLIRGLRQLSEDPHYREDLRKRSLLRSRAFSWATTAAETAKVYQRLVSDSCPRGQESEAPGDPAYFHNSVL